MAPIFAAFPAECSGGWRLYCFHLCQFQRARGQGKGSFGITGSREGRTLLSVSWLLQGIVAKPLLTPNPSPGLPSLFWSTKIQSWGSQVCFRVPNLSLLRRMQLFSGGTCGETGMVTGTPSTLAAPSWLGTSGVRHYWVSPRGDTGLEGQLHRQGGKRAWECTNILCNREKVSRYQRRIRKGAGGWEQTGTCPFQWRISGSMNTGRSFGGRAALIHRTEPWDHRWDICRWQNHPGTASPQGWGKGGKGVAEEQGVIGTCSTTAKLGGNKVERH